MTGSSPSGEDSLSSVDTMESFGSIGLESFDSIGSTIDVDSSVSVVVSVTVVSDGSSTGLVVVVSAVVSCVDNFGASESIFSWWSVKKKKKKKN